MELMCKLESEQFFGGSFALFAEGAGFPEALTKFAEDDWVSALFPF
jgi:hypothetical protein